jgi:hypothetical protein
LLQRDTKQFSKKCFDNKNLKKNIGSTHFELNGDF